MKTRLIAFLTIFSLALLPALMVPQTSYAQKKTVSTKKQNKKNKDAKGRAEEKEAGMKDVEKELNKRHMRIQEKETRKRIKRNKKKSMRLKKGKREEGFFRRLFRKK